MAKVEHVYYTRLESPIGTIWVAATDEGLFQVEIGRTEVKFLESIGKRIRAEIMEDPGRFDEIREMFKDYFDGRVVVFDLPFDLRGTDFQRNVWRAIYRIPHGKLSSYSRLAAEVGRPRAARAVGNAVGSNPLWIVIPCHRAVRSDGSLGGYLGGLPMKRALLEMEGVQFDASGRVSQLRSVG